MKSIGGYLELDSYTNEIFHKNAVALNCGRNCLEYAIVAHNIKKIKLPYFLCSSVRNKCDKIGIETSFYYIDESFLPSKDIALEKDEWLYIVNYYGIINNDIMQKLISKYSNRVILDYSHCFFIPPIKKSITIYSCRKFFGVPDGAYIYIDKKVDVNIPLDVSYKRMNYLLGRYELTAEPFYKEYVENNKMFANEPMKKMSKLTENLLRGINYEFVEKKRSSNFIVLNELLKDVNQLNLQNILGAYAYPLLLPNGAEVRNKLIEKKIYVPTLWGNALEYIEKSSLEYYFINNILPLPCDQRYNDNDMEYIAGEVLKCIG